MLERERLLERGSIKDMKHERGKKKKKSVRQNIGDESVPNNILERKH